MTTADKPSYSVIGTRPIRPDGVEKVTGVARYAADANMAGLVHARFLRSPHAHARILAIDTSEAEKMPGVVAIATNADFPTADNRDEDMMEDVMNLREISANLLARDKVLYHGHAVAAVAARSPHEALAAIEKIKVEYQVLPHVLDVRDAMRDDAPILDETRRTHSIAGQVSDKPTNVSYHNRFEEGDVARAFAEADHVVEREFTTQMVHQGYIEPQSSTVMWNPDDTITVYTSTQGHFSVRSQVAGVLRLPISRVRVYPMEIGGGFGGKNQTYTDAVAAVLSKKCGRPVKLTLSREEVLRATGPTSGSYIHIKAAEKGGKLTGVEAELCYEAGAFPRSPIGGGMGCMLSPYNLENYRIDGYDVVDNRPKVAAYRAPGAPAAAFAIESVVDELARLAGTDPLSFRLNNASHEGTRRVDGTRFGLVGNEACVKAAMASPHWNSPIEGPNRGRGVASGFWHNGGRQSTVIASVNTDGTINMIEGSVDIGGSRASISMQLAETLGVPVDLIRPIIGDTDSIGHSDNTGGSRVTHATGIAAYEAGMDVRRQMCARAAGLWECDVADVVYDKAVLSCKSDPSKTLTFKDIAAKMAQTGGPIQGRGAVFARGVGAAFATHIVDVEVDPDTGKVEILRYTAVQDVGTAVHPSYVEGQVQGGVVQGIGWALNEEYVYDENGRMVNASLLDYRMPTSLDVPMIDTILVEVPNPGHPFGVRGVGEVPLVPPLAAIANAIADATGHRFTDLPISPRRVVEALHGLE